jgi:hypothetical protein
MHQANGAIGSDMPAELVTFAHATLFSPALSTLQKALDKGYISNFPGLTTSSLRKYPPRSIPMVKGHLKQTRQNQRSTKAKATKSPPVPFQAIQFFWTTRSPRVKRPTSKLTSATRALWRQLDKSTVTKLDDSLSPQIQATITC